MNHHQTWLCAQEVSRVMAAQYTPAMDLAAESFGLSKPNWYGWLLPALIFEPEPISTARLRVRMPYIAPSLYDQRLEEGALAGFLAQVAPGDYRLSEKGRQAAEAVIQAAYQAMAELPTLPKADMQHLEDLLRRLVISSLEAAEPPGKWSLRLSRRTEHGRDLSRMARIDQYLSDLNAYRDDAHLAAWQPLGVAGHTWEAFTFLWRGEAETLDALIEKLARRGYTREDYAQSLGELVQRGWVEAHAEKYRLTPEGAHIRQQAEEQTDTYFFTPWLSLRRAELNALHNLLERLRDRLQV